MNTGKAVYGILSTNSGVTDLVGTNIFPEIAEQETATPFIVYQLQSVAPEDTHDGPSKLDEVRFEFICYADNYDAAADIGVKVRAALDRVSGTYNGVNVESVQFNDVDINIEYDPRRYSQVLTFTFRIKRDDFTIAQGTPVTGAQLGDLSDVNVTGVSNGQLIAYNSTSGNWEAADDAGGAQNLNDLSDVNIALPENRNVLMYDGAEFVDDNVSKSDVGLSNVDNTSDANKPVSTATQTALNAKADTSAVPTELNDLSDVTITGTPAGNEALIFDTTSSSFKSLPNFTNRFEDEAENDKPLTPFSERVYSVKADGDGIFIDAQSDTPTAGKVIERKIYHKAGFVESGDVIGDFTLIHTFADDTAYSATESVFEGFRDGDTYGSPPFTLLQTWEEATAAPSFTGLLNESYGSGAAASYSVRRLNGNYTGAAIEVERTSDGTYQDIGFDVNGDLDESALTTFCTGTTCKVSKWYDQSQTGGTGSGNDAVQATHGDQPTIYTGGAIVKDNGRVALDFDGGQDSLDTGQSIRTATTFTVSKSTSSGRSTVYGSQSGGSQYLRTDGTVIDFSNTQGLELTGQISGSYNLIFVDNISPNTSLGNNGGAVVTGSLDTSNIADFAIGQKANGNTHQGTIQEVILYDTTKASNRTSIESNIGDYYTQNTPLLDTYTGAAAAYSLRKLRTAYSGSAIRVRRRNDNAEADIGFNVFGELDTVSLAAHCGSNDGFVKTWYDQASTNDATQTTTANQPKIYDGTTGVVTENGKPALYFNSDYLADSVTMESSASDYTFVSITNLGTGGDLFDVESGRLILDTRSGAYYSGNYRGTQYRGQQYLKALLLSSANGTQRIDGAQVETGLTYTPIATTGLRSIGAQFNGGRAVLGNVQEILLYPNVTVSITGIESNINTFYSIY